MSLSKQLYIIISFIFFAIFAGNFIISVNNFKEYLELESKTKAQDTATSLGMSIKSLIDNPNDPEIKAIIKAIANRGFYKEIRLENANFTFTKDELLKDTKFDSSYTIEKLSINDTFGKISTSKDDDSLENELALLEGYESEQTTTNTTYTFTPSKEFKNHQKLNLSITISKDGNTQEIKKNISVDKVIFKESRAEKFDSVPQWFINLLPLKMEEKNSQISNGWTTQAIIYVSANAGDAYFKLYNQAKGAIYYAAVAFIVSILLLVVFLRFILTPLFQIEKLAKEISTGNFQTIKKLPWTTELKNVSISMNEMSDKIKNMIDKLNTNLEKMTDQLSKDDLTGLQQEQTFQTDMKQMFIKKEDGYIFSVKVDDLGSLAKNNTHEIVNKFLKDFSTILQTSHKNLEAYRFFGSTFAMICKETEHEEIVKVTQKIKQDLDNLAKQMNINSIAHIGVTPFNPISTTTDILSLANEALEMSKQIGYNESYIRDKDDLARDMLQWKKLIFDIIDNKKFSVNFINQAKNLNNPSQTLIEEAFTQAKDNSNKAIPIGTFISIAEQYNKVIDFDKAVILKVIEHIHEDKINHEVLINLSFESLQHMSFKIWLEETLQNNRNIASQLVFSVTAYGCVKDIDSFKNFITLVHENGGKIILKRFETKFIPLNNLKELNLDYIRLARDYTNKIDTDASKQNFVESICELSKLLNIKVFAESVEDKNFEIIKNLGIDGASN